MQRMGCMQMPGFLVRFSSSVVCGQARFVPASGDAKGCIGQSCYVEIDQEKITNVHPATPGSIEGVTALADAGAFLVVGTVVSIVPIQEPAGAIVTVTAREARYTLSSDEFGNVVPSPGDRVTFVAHDLSLWDEAI